MEDLIKISVDSETTKILEALESSDIMIEQETNPKVKESLQHDKQMLIFKLTRKILEWHLTKEGLTNELIAKFAKLDVQESLAERSSSNKNQYDLSSKSIVSKKTGETINLEFLSNFEKIRLIYEHTGEKISYEDKALYQNVNSACNEFISFLVKTKGKKELIKQYGDDWQNKIQELYNQGYKEAIKFQIDKITNEIDEKNKIKEHPETKESKENVLVKENEKLKRVVVESNKTIELLSKENVTLKQEVTKLKGQVADMQQEHKKNMEELKAQMIVMNSSKEMSANNDVEQQMLVEEPAGKKR